MDILTDIAAANGGYFRAAHARDCGYTSRDLQRACRLGVIRRIRHGTYAFADVWDDLSREDRHVTVTKAVVNESGGAVAACSVSACAVRKMSLWGHDLTNVHVMRLGRGASRREAGVVHHRAKITEADVEVVDGVPCVRAPRAVCEAGVETGLEAGVVLYDSALNLREVTEESLDRQAAAMEHCPNTRKVRFGVRLADGRAESPGESRNRFLFYRFNIPKPDLQVHIRAGDGRLIGITDVAWELYCHVGEFDGLVKYLRAFADDNRSPEQVVIDEKLREEAIRREHKGMARTIWSELDRSAAAETGGRTRSDLEGSRKTYAKNRVTIA